MKLIGFTGKKYSGKDTAAKALVDDIYEQTAYADPLREMLYTLNPIVSVATPTGDKRDTEVCTWREAWDTVGYDEMKTWPEVRRLMQVYGTEVMRRQFGEDVWVDLTMKKIDHSDCQHWVITDVRFDNEAKAVRSRGGHVIEIVWSGPRTRDDHGAEHTSEAGISRGLVDGTLHNGLDIPMEQFHADVRRMVEVLTR